MPRYLRETWILPPLDDWLSKVFLPHRLDDTIDLMAGAAPASDEKSTAEAARTVIADCDAKLATAQRSKPEPEPTMPSSPNGSPRRRPAKPVP
ncbi:hypothetical protein [Streptomyces sp. 061-3]|uniref:hypothetical protein n=1 Tax=Streptomyces sp. 061-3 TaxID=2789268 RepID=UPI00398190C5